MSMDVLGSVAPAQMVPDDTAMAVAHFARKLKTTFADKRDFLASLDMLAAMSQAGRCTSELTLIVGGLNNCLFAAKFLEACPQMTLHGFEIQKHHIESCRHRLKSWAHAHVHNEGMSEAEGTASIVADCASRIDVMAGRKACKRDTEGAAEMASITLKANSSRLGSGASVKTIGLRAFLAREHVRRVDFSIIDTEGHEESVIQGMQLLSAASAQVFGIFQYELSAMWTDRDGLRDAWTGNTSQLVLAWRLQALKLERVGYSLYIVGARTNGCKLTTHDGYACRGKAVYMHVHADFFSAIANAYEALSREATFVRNRYSPSFNVVAVHGQYADPTLSAFVEARRIRWDNGGAAAKQPPGRQLETVESEHVQNAETLPLT